MNKPWYLQLLDQLAHAACAAVAVGAVKLTGAQLGPYTGLVIGLACGFTREVTEWTCRKLEIKRLRDWGFVSAEHHLGTASPFTPSSMLDYCGWMLGGWAMGSQLQ